MRPSACLRLGKARVLGAPNCRSPSRPGRNTRPPCTSRCSRYRASPLHASAHLRPSWCRGEGCLARPIRTGLARKRPRRRAPLSPRSSQARVRRSTVANPVGTVTNPVGKDLQHPCGPVSPYPPEHADIRLSPEVIPHTHKREPYERERADASLTACPSKDMLSNCRLGVPSSAKHGAFDDHVNWVENARSERTLRRQVRIERSLCVVIWVQARSSYKGDWRVPD